MKRHYEVCLPYTPIGRIRTDRSRFGLIFARSPVTRQAYTVGIAEDQFLIPAYQDNMPVASSLTLSQETRLLGFMPHMHLRGKDFRYSVSRPGKPAEVLLSVPAYDFGWQSSYTLFDEMMIGYIDVDSPVGDTFSREQPKPTGPSAPARAALQAVSSLLGVRKNASPRSGAGNSPR